ncbi:MAG: (2Fe-2S)-binding protein [Austwickia sp.]|jgi:aerobic carbon-monoxide dehydrogenase small subunit|nr:(2Fe-2S)-binding protein [Austwickia sp.]MBK8437827.1 (2Fe-2S)-binding protein [Austwickia sp.]MBK9100134.1 (2Fe-2S)-binding protein [Austwickia sp.]
MTRHIPVPHASVFEVSATSQEEEHEILLRVNGVEHALAVPARRLLSDALRHDLGLTGTHVGCEHGVCGACTVLLDEQPIRSCLIFAVSAAGHEIRTVEGLADPETGDLGPVQRAFIESHALQCGFCTPGMMMTIEAFIAENPEPDLAQAREAISGNLCRCTGYQNIVKAVCRAAELARDDAAGGQR